MTCIVGIAQDDVVYMGGDRGASDGQSILPLTRPKIKICGDYIIGYAGSQGIGEMLHFIDLPPIGRNIEKTLRTLFTKSLKSALEEFGGYSDTEDNSTDWIIGTKGRLFEISSEDWSVCEFEYTAIGSGGSFALGSLHTTMNWKDPYRRIHVALDAATTLSPTCQTPIDILKI